MVGDDLLEDGGGEVACAGEVEDEFVERDFVKGEPGGGAEADADGGLGAEVAGEVEGGDVAGVVTDFLNADGKEVDVVRGAECAGSAVAFAEDAFQDGASRDNRALGEVGLLFVGGEADDGHRGDGGEEVRVDCFEERLGEAGELGVELEVDAGGEVGEAFKEAFDVGVGAGVGAGGVEREASGDLGKLLRKLGRRHAEVAEFVVVIIEEAFVHISTFGLIYNLKCIMYNV
nr:hypothetical protein [Ereboglobus luteus]